jgi:hypothetical protein
VVTIYTICFNTQELFFFLSTNCIISFAHYSE